MVRSPLPYGTCKTLFIYYSFGEYHRKQIQSPLNTVGANRISPSERLSESKNFKFSFFSFLFLKFIYYLRERGREQGMSRETGRQRSPSRLCTVSTEPDVGLDLRDREITT